MLTEKCICSSRWLFKIGKLFLKGADSKYFRFCGLYRLLQLVNSAIAAQKLLYKYVNKLVRLCFSKTLFAKRGSRVHLAQRPYCASLDQGKTPVNGLYSTSVVYVIISDGVRVPSGNDKHQQRPLLFSRDWTEWLNRLLLIYRFYSKQNYYKEIAD